MEKVYIKKECRKVVKVFKLGWNLARSGRNKPLIKIGICKSSDISWLDIKFALWSGIANGRALKYSTLLNELNRRFKVTGESVKDYEIIESIFF